MVDCNPVCTVPSCASAPTIGFGSQRLRHYEGLEYGYGGLGYGNFGGCRAHFGGALAESTGNLGILPGAHISCINQLPPAEAVIQPPSFNVTIPGPIISASCEPLQVGGNAPCAVGSTGLVGGFGHGGYGYGLGHDSYSYGLNHGYLGARSICGRRGSVCN